MSMLLAVLLAGPQLLQAQKIKIVSGNLKFLKGVDQFDLAYDYEGMAVGKFKNEEDYLNERQAKLNEKEPGTGDQWRESWFADRDNRFHPKFEELLNKNLGNKANARQNNDKAPYTILLKTVFTEPGFNVGVARRNASIDVEIHFIDKATGETRAVMEMSKIPGRGGFDYDTGIRIMEAYAKCGKELGKYLVKKAL
ncbi:MAG: hypothetical protein D6730_01700 [Bacteroidetes bacterium]|nr:MAG: hypothetical protein D6730_01700 [Bacteroidota bacterium]